MESRENFIGILIMILISIGVIALTNLINLEEQVISWIILIATIVLVFIIFSIGSINENKRNISKNRDTINNLEKQLDFHDRLTIVEKRLKIK